MILDATFEDGPLVNKVGKLLTVANHIIEHNHPSYDFTTSLPLTRQGEGRACKTLAKFSKKMGEQW